MPLNIPAGHHSFSIGYNPFMLSDTTGIFIISPSQTSSAGPFPAPINTAGATYNGCGLPPLPDYTYTGYQPPCTITTSGRVETIYPIVPASDSSLFFGSSPLGISPPTTASATPPTTVDRSTAINTAFATGVFAQALQCPTPVTPSTTQITSGDVTTIISLVACDPTPEASQPGVNSGNGVCHTSGYITYSVSGTSSVCCPNGWATTPLNSELFCFTSMTVAGMKRAAWEHKRGLTETLTGIALTTAGVVTSEAAIIGGSTTAGSGTSSSTSTGSEAGKTNASSGTAMRGLGVWESFAVAIIPAVILRILF